MTEAKRLNARASVLVERRRPVIDAWRRSRKKFVEKTAKPTWTSVWQNAGKELKFQNQTLSIETSFSFSSNFRYVLIFLSFETVASPLSVKANAHVQFVTAQNHGQYAKQTATLFLESNATTPAGIVHLWSRIMAIHVKLYPSHHAINQLTE